MQLVNITHEGKEELPEYLQAIYWSLLFVTGDHPIPSTIFQQLYVIIQILAGLLLLN